MVSRIDLGPDGGPYVELDEDAGEFIIRVPQDNVSFDGADLNSVGTASVTSLEAESVSTERTDIRGSDAVTIDVPGDENSLSDAIDRASEIYLRRGIGVEINIESGHNPTSGIIVENGDWSFVTISATDDMVSVDSSFTGDFIRGTNAWLPVLNCVIDMDGNGGTGYYAVHSSVGKVENGAGVINAGEHGLECRTSTVFAGESNFSGATQTGLRVQQGGRVAAANVDLSGSGNRGIYASRGSMVHAIGSSTDISGVEGDEAVRVIRSRVVVEDANISNASVDGLSASSGGIISAKNCNVSNAGQNALYAVGGSIVDARDANLSDAGEKAMEIQKSSRVSAQNADCSGSSSGVAAVAIREGSTGDLSEADLSNADSGAIEVLQGSFADATNADFSDGSRFAIAWVARGSWLTIDSADIFGIDSADDEVRTERGAIVSAWDCQVGDANNPDEFAAGNSNLSDLNAIESDGIIFHGTS